MACPRCQSLLVPEVFVDYEADSGSMSFLGYRCVVCGDILDATILRHRAGHWVPLFSGTRKPRLLISVGRKSITGDDGGEEGFT